MLKSLLRVTLVFVIWSSSSIAGPLHDAVKDGDLARLQELIEAGEDLAAQDKFVGTALHWAALKNDSDAARLLINAAADVNSPKVGGHETALHIAAERGSAEVATILIEAGADIEARTFGQNFTTLHFAASADSVEVARLLIEAGADIEAAGRGRDPPLFAAAFANAAGTVELLVISGANIDAKLTSGRTALLTAVMYRAPEAVKKLLELGADVNGAPETEPVEPITPLAWAIANKSDEIADILREAGASE
jgi:ankyrin repeat protein